METIGPCIKWIPILWRRMFRRFTQNGVADFHDDIIIEVFSRLPAECVYQCRYLNRTLHALTSSQTFIDMHLSRAPSSIAIQCFRENQIRYLQNGVIECTIQVYFIEGSTRKMVQTSISFRDVGNSKFRLIGSYRGLLLLQRASCLLVWNPVTDEKVIVDKPGSSNTKGFFLDPNSGDYKVLFMNDLHSSFQFTIYNLRCRVSKESCEFSYAPGPKPPVILNGALHWIVDEELYERATSSRLQRSESIVVFDMESEMIRTMRRPGCKLSERIEDSYVHLVHWGGSLCFCDASSNLNMDIWVLEAYAEEVWVKKLALSLEFMGKPLVISSRPCYYVYAMRLDKDELLVICGEAIYGFNLKSNTSRKIKLQGVHGRLDHFSFVVHTSSPVQVKRSI